MAKKHLDQVGSWVFAGFVTIGIATPLVYMLLTSDIKTERIQELERLAEEAKSKEAVWDQELSPENEAYQWGYEGSNGPKYWADLNYKYKACRTGKEQSPIDLSSGYAVQDDYRLNFAYKETPAQIQQIASHLIVDYKDGSHITLGTEPDQKYSLKELMVHTPSEHTVNGRHLDMEFQFIHQSENGSKAIVSVFAKKGANHPTIEKIAEHFPGHQGDRNAIEDVNVQSLLPSNRNYFSYKGSLTHPPCKEGVMWYVMRTPIEVSTKQYEQFVERIKFNARPTQNLNERVIKLSTLNVN